MPLNAKFYNKVEELEVTFMGTENVAPLLYSLVRTRKPNTALEVGLGYTSPFLAQALADCKLEDERDRKVLTLEIDDKDRYGLLNPENFQSFYKPKLYAIDDYSLDGTSAPKVIEVLDELDLKGYVDVCVGDFRGRSTSMPKVSQPIDFVWFDCGGRYEYIDFFKEYWPLVNPDHGLVVLHFTYWNAPISSGGKVNNRVVMGSIANEIKRQQLESGVESQFEVLSLLEPHKSRQGSVTLIRKLPWNSKCRDVDFQQEVTQIFGETCDSFIKL